MTLLFARFWAFLKSVPATAWAALAAAATMFVLYLQRKNAQEHTRLAQEKATRAEDGKRQAESKNVAITHTTKAEVAVQHANEISAERESIRNETVSAIEHIEDLSDEDITQMMLRDAEEAAAKRKNKK